MSYVDSVVISLKMLFSGQAGFTDLSGPVGIVNMMADTAEAAETAADALIGMLEFGGLIAINLAVMNLLPLPALDGGRVVCLLLTTGIQAVTKKKLNPKIEGYIHAGGMILLLLLMAAIMLKDVIFLFK
jgi:regulator of sigma E protease